MYINITYLVRVMAITLVSIKRWRFVWWAYTPRLTTATPRYVRLGIHVCKHTATGWGETPCAWHDVVYSLSDPNRLQGGSLLL